MKSRIKARAHDEGINHKCSDDAANASQLQGYDNSPDQRAGNKFAINDAVKKTAPHGTIATYIPLRQHRHG